MTHTGWIWTVVVCIVALWASVAHATPDLALWETLDIVPMPKEIELTGRELPSADAVLVLGASASRQDEIGAQWINDRIAQLGGQPLSVVSAAEATDAPLRIVIGTRESNSVIEAAAAAATIELGPGEPGEKGYVILSHPHGEATEILLAGADNIGALYAGTRGTGHRLARLPQLHARRAGRHHGLSRSGTARRGCQEPGRF